MTEGKPMANTLETEIHTLATAAVAEAVKITDAVTKNIAPETGMLKTAFTDLKYLNQRLTRTVESLDHHIDALLGPTPAKPGELPAQPVAKSFMDALHQEIVQAHNIVNLVEARIGVFTKAIHG
jgi:hypothetical protein